MGERAGEDDDAAAPDADRRGSAATYASNWRTVLLVDASVGAAVAIVGAVVAVWFSLVVGALLGVAGVAYVVAVARRGRAWAELRRRAGL